MATKSQQKRKQKQEKRRKRKAELQKRRTTTSTVKLRGLAAMTARQRERLKKQQPQAWPGELPEDVAVFDDAVLASLDSTRAGEVRAIRDALQFADQGHRDAAAECVSSIPRNSPLSEWRIFLRGLLPWLDDRFEAAHEAWRRLDSARRPHRIARVMSAAQNHEWEASGADAASQPTSEDPGNAHRNEAAPELDDLSRYHAKLLHQTWFDRPAIRLALSGTKVTDEKGVKIGSKQLGWLAEFAREYRDTEPQLVEAMERSGLQRAYAQPYADIFMMAREALQGPPHDPHNTLLCFHYLSRFEDTKDLDPDDFLDRYLEQELPANSRVQPALRDAILSMLHLKEAEWLLAHSRRSMFDLFFRYPDDRREIRGHLQAAAKACPKNRAAHRAFANWLEDQLESDAETKAEREPLLKQLAGVMRRWSKGLPEDPEPRVWLLDYLMEREELKEASRHVEWLRAARHESPHVRSAPWKWELMEAMRLCRRKTWLKDVPAHLEQAQALWPDWFHSRWMPYLQAALTLRSGERETFEQSREDVSREAGVAAHSLTDACMMLGAAQKMRVPSADLKPLREPVDAAAKAVSEVPLNELLDVAVFFWDLERSDLQYPSYRMHGHKFLRALFERFSTRPEIVLDSSNDGRIHAATLLASMHRFWRSGCGYGQPEWLKRTEVSEHPMFVAAYVNHVVRHRWIKSGELEGASELLRSAASRERNTYYRFWFRHLADQLDSCRESTGSGEDSFFQRMVDEVFGVDDDDEC